MGEKSGWISPLPSDPTHRPRACTWDVPLAEEAVDTVATTTAEVAAMVGTTDTIDADRPAHTDEGRQVLTVGGRQVPTAVGRQVPTQGRQEDLDRGRRDTELI